MVYPEMLESYLEWDCNGVPIFDQKTYTGACFAPIKIYDIFGASSVSNMLMFADYYAENSHRSFPIIENKSSLSTMVRFGYMGNSPLKPSCGFSLKLLELFSVMNSRCPQLSIYRFTRSLCDLQQVCLRPQSSTQTLIHGL